MIKQFIKLSAVAAFAFAFVVAPVASAATTAVYDAVPSPLPSSYPSLGFEASQTAEFGAKIQFAAGERKFDSATIVMNSWACETGQWEQGNCLTTTPGSTFSQELTLNIYSADGSLSPIDSFTQTFQIPHRPSTDPTCAPGNAAPTVTAWKNADGNCQDGYNAPVTFDLGDITLPDEIVFGIEYNTLAWGYSPIGSTGPFDSLNVSLVQTPTNVSAGTQVGIYRAYAANGNSFAPEEDWGTYAVAAQFNAVDAVVPPATPQSKDDCKKDGWKTLVNANGGSSKNQGQCVSYVTASENSKAKRGDTLAPSVRF